MNSHQALSKRRTLESQVALHLLKIYCKGHPNGKSDYPNDFNPKIRLCPNCAKLADQLLKQIRYCPQMATKTFCHHCPKPCHRPNAEVAKLMRTCGPKLVYRYPILACRYFSAILKAKKQQNKGVKLSSSD